MDIPAPPPAADWTAKLPASLGEFHNDSLGDCTCAGIYHALQVWSANVGAIDTEPDDNAMLLYEQACGYVPGNTSTDQGGVEQDVLSYVMLSGAPAGAGGTDRHRLTAFVEIDPRNIDDVKIAISGAGLVYIGFQVPNNLPMTAGATWDIEPSADYSIEGGHCVVLPAYDDASSTFKAISWGSLYTMTYAFFNEFVDECYMIADPDFFNATGATPGGLTLASLEAQMSALRSSGN